MSVRDRADDDLAFPVPTDDQLAVLDVRIRFTPTLPVVRLAGELDLSSVHLLTDALDAIAAAECPAELVVLDLSELAFCDIAGLRGMEEGGAALRRAGKELMLYHPPTAVVRLIKLTGVARRLTCR